MDEDLRMAERHASRAAAAETSEGEVPVAEEDRNPRRYPLRTCIVTREVLPRQRMLRFVLSPEGEVVFDPRAELPGRGAWLKPAPGIIEEALRRNAFARAFRQKVRVPPDLEARVRRQLEQQAVQLLSLARKAGEATSGFDRVAGWIDAGKVAVLVQAADGARDGRRKLAARLRREGRTAEIVDFLDSAQLGLAFGRPNVIHAALRHGGLARRFLALARMIAALSPESGAAEKETGRKEHKPRRHRG
jgi:hypothetical protein